VDQIQHLALIVSDLDDAIEYYKTRFDLKISYSDKSWALLEFLNILMVLVLPNQHPPHIAIALDNPRSFGPLKHHRDGTASTYIKDPWGNFIEIMQNSRGDTQL
jgi:catechol 2,3-dioxygenase-like lactoylglutathione lyase family enzyme